MIKKRKSSDRGFFDHGWLKTYHTFSFGEYFDATNMGFRALRVMNEDYISGGNGFGMHGHQDMEIVTYIIDGELEHQDSVGNRATISQGEVQRMTAGTGIRHSEKNHLQEKTTHLLQIWILPAKPGLAPGYEQKKFSQDHESGKLVTLVSADGRDGSLSIHQDVVVFGSKAKTKQKWTYPITAGRGLWLQIISGEFLLNDQTAQAGDGIAIENESEIHLESLSDASEFLLFDLA